MSKTVDIFVVTSLICRLFGSFAQYLNDRMDYIPLTFLLGFFVTIVVDRWKNIFANIGFVDK